MEEIAAPLLRDDLQSVQVTCLGHKHAKAGMGDNLPRYESELGLVEH